MLTQSQAKAAQERAAALLHKVGIALTPKERDIEARVGRIEQVGGIRRLAWAEGREAGAEMVEVRTGNVARWRCWLRVRSVCLNLSYGLNKNN